MAWLVEADGVSPHSLMAVTFTNKAAREMRGRLEQLLRINARTLWVGTFHGLAHRFLRQHWQEAGLTASFQILDADDQLRLIKRLYRELQLDEGRWPPRQTQWFINSQKDEGLRAADLGQPADPFQRTMTHFYAAYEQECRRTGVVDFAELLLLAYETLGRHEHLLQHYQQRFSHLLVDEFQDTNQIQYRWLRRLSGAHTLVTVVGDDDQSIYGWRGARIENIQRFCTDFAGARTVRLEQNYRSTKVILKTADSVIKNNSKQLEKSLWTENEAGKPIVVIESQNDRDEAKKVISYIHHYKLQYGYQNKDFAVLYRTNFQSRLFEDALRFKNIPYQIVGGISFYQRKEVKDVLAYLTLLVNTKDSTSLLRIINEPARGIGDKTIETVREYASKEGISIWEALNDIDKIELRGAAKNSIKRFVKAIESVQSEMGERSILETARTLLERSEYMKQYNEDNTDESIDRRSNVLALLDAIAQHEENTENPSLSTFLQEVTLLTDADEQDEHSSRVTLMTMHAAKGLEFPVVFVVGLEEELFPIAGRAGEDTDIEEERRLFYVAITRAEKELFFSYSKNRYRFGTETRMMRSRFLEETDTSMLVMENGTNFKSKSLSSRTNTYIDRSDYVDESWKQKKPTGSRSTSSRIHLEPSGIEDFQVGVEVHHQKFGEGKIQHIEGKGADTRLTVFFPSAGQKTLLLRFAKLSILG
jgi:DNA helicase-2/ATP-dependent DNA helicase PcrA